MIEEKVNFEEWVPPWVVFPEIKPEELVRYLRQGVTQAYFDHVWRPFWSKLTSAQKDQYLDYWKATPAWREELAFVFEIPEGFDMEEDARESEEWLRQRREERNKK